jgi:hypothetical protein
MAFIRRCSFVPSGMAENHSEALSCGVISPIVFSVNA